MSKLGWEGSLPGRTDPCRALGVFDVSEEPQVVSKEHESSAGLLATLTQVTSPLLGTNHFHRSSRSSSLLLIPWKNLCC